MNPPRVVIGATLYNHAAELPEALESILTQTYRDFALVLVDDASTDDTPAIAQRYAETDDRVCYERNERRLGMVGNWRRAFQLARDRCPNADYFAWASDHDVWHPRWLRALVSALDGAPDVVLAYPLNHRIGASGERAAKRPWRFDTAGVTDMGRRFRLTLWHMSAGNMTYGLARAAAIERAGIFRRVLVPDRLLLMELALEGQFKQVREVLWLRRWYGRIFSLGRQRRAFFPDGRPLYAYCPWWISHAVSFAWILGVRAERRPEISRWRGFGLAARYLVLAGLLHARAQLKQLRVDLLERATLLRPVYHGWRRIRRGTMRRLGIKERKHHYPTKAMTRPKTRRRVGRAAGRARHRSGVAALRLVRSLPLMQSRIIPWLVRQELDEVPAGREVGLMRRELRQISLTRHPIVVGPWLSEVGFETLYWIPFLNWASEHFGLRRDQLIAVSRGGAGDWYRDIVGQSVDIFDLMSVEEFRRRSELRWMDGGNQKQLAVGAQDRHVLRLVKTSLGLDEIAVLHPGIMYRLFRDYWCGKGAVSLLRRHTDFRSFPEPDTTDIALDLPEEFVAVRFYFRPSFPDTPENRALVDRLVRTLAERVPVVLLNTGLSLDDHHDVRPAHRGRIQTVEHLMRPSRNLAVQSAVISRARAFVGTYGGLAYLGPYYGVPAVALYSNAAELIHAHLDVSRRYSRALGVPLTMLHTGEISQLGSLLSSEGGPGSAVGAASVSVGARGGREVGPTLERGPDGQRG